MERESLQKLRYTVSDDSVSRQCFIQQCPATVYVSVDSVIEQDHVNLNFVTFFIEFSLTMIHCNFFSP